MRYMIYPVYHREGYGYQQDNPEGTDGKPIYYVLYEECLDGGEGYEIVDFGPTMVREMQQVADFFNLKEAELLEDTLLAKRNINKDDSTNSKYPEEGEKESE